jgi:hypothetical protein
MVCCCSQYIISTVRIGGQEKRNFSCDLDYGSFIMSIQIYYINIHTGQLAFSKTIFVTVPSGYFGIFRYSMSPSDWSYKYNCNGAVSYTRYIANYLSFSIPLLFSSFLDSFQYFDNILGGLVDESFQMPWSHPCNGMYSCY